MKTTNLTTTFIKFIFPFFLAVFVLPNLACNGTTPSAPTTSSTDQITVEAFDQEGIDLYLNQYVIEPQVPLDLTGDLSNLNIVLADPSNTNLLPSADAYTPVMQMTPDVQAYIAGTIQSLNQAPVIQIEQFNALGFDRWYKDTLMHSTNHLRMLGMNQYDIRSTTTFIYQIIQGGLNGQGQVVYRPSAGSYSEAYGFFTQINGKTWIMWLDAKTGAPITTWMTGLSQKGNPSTYNEARAAAEMSKILLRGSSVIPSSSIPQHIRDSWGTTPPSAIRILWWALSYQMRVETAKVGATFTAYTLEAWNALSSAITKVGQIKVIPVFMLLIQDECGNWIAPENYYNAPTCTFQ